MAEFNGTAANDIYSGTSGDDVIFGLGGNDTLNGAGGDDQINGGAGVDNVAGGSGNDVITVDAGEGAGGSVDGGTGTDTLVTALQAGNTLDFTGGVASNIGNLDTLTIENIERLQVSNASNFMLTVGTDAVFGLDTNVVNNDGTPVATATPIHKYDASAGTISAVAAEAAAGVVIGGTTYMAGDTFATAEGGEVTITHDGTDWSFSYAAAERALYAVGDSVATDDDIAADMLTATVTDTDGNTVDVALDFTINLNADFDATGAASGIVSNGDSQANTMTGSNFNDVIWAGADSGDEVDTLNGLEGNDVLAGGGGDDIIGGDEGNDTLYGGAGADNIAGDDGDDVIWAGAGNDVAVTGGADNDIIGGGLGDDAIDGGAGNDTLYGGADDGADALDGGADDDVIYGGAGADNVIGNAGNDLLFNGADNDGVDGGAGNDTLWGGAGNDNLTGGADDDTFGFVSGNGNDTIADFGFDGTDPLKGDDVLDLTAYSYANTQEVLDDMTDVGGSAVLALAPGQTVTFTGLTKNDFQSAVDDWVLV